MPDRSASCTFDRRVRVRSGYGYCRALVEDIGPRPAGRPGEKKAAEYIASELRRSGLKQVRLEPYRCQSMQVLACTLRCVTPDLGEVDAYAGIYSGATRRGGVTADLLYFDSAGDIEWSSGKLRGKALLAYGGFGRGARDLARKAGVACLITAADRQRRIFHLDGWPVERTAPHINIGYWDAARLVKEGCRRVHIDCRTRIRPATSHNVVGLVKGADPKAQTLSLSAHYDSVPGTPGAGDNAAGVAVAMAAADSLQQRPPRGDVRVVLFGGEEIGLWGARAYARDHTSWWRNMRLAVYFDGMGDVIGRNKVQVNGYHDVLDWATEVAEGCGYRCDAQDSISMLDNAWLNYYGVPSIRPWRPPQIHWHGALDDMSVMSEQVMLDNARYAVELLHRASAEDPAPFTAGIPHPMLHSIREHLDGSKSWGYIDKFPTGSQRMTRGGPMST